MLQGRGWPENVMRIFSESLFIALRTVWRGIPRAIGMGSGFSLSSRSTFQQQQTVLIL